MKPVEVMILNEYIEQLTDRLLKQNQHLTYNQARAWVEHLWEDFESTYAKAGYEYKGKEMTAKIVVQWIDNHGATLHEFLSNNPKYAHLFTDLKH